MATAPDPLRVLVAADHVLVGGAVKAALARRGLQVVVIRWPSSKRRASRRRAPPPAASMTEVGLLLCDLESAVRIEAARSIVEGIPVPWLVLTTSPRGPTWGGLLDAGAAVVLSADTGLEHVCSVLSSVARQLVATPEDERSELETAWHEACARHRDVSERIGRLTPRELEVLRMMYGGCSVAEIAETFEVASETVRTQVKAVLRKLEVKTQLAAVAMFDDALEGIGQRGTLQTASARGVGSGMRG
jgi:two-component system nitrate/nitrite response regulator NarL